jgi:penicillin-binding protein 1A
VAEKKVPLDSSQKSADREAKKFGFPKLKINRKTLKTVALVILILIVAAGLSVAGVLISYAASAPELDPAALEAVEASYIFDREEREITQLHAAENRVIVPIEEIPEQLQKAFIAIEDERFYKHRGVDLLSLGRAVLVNIREGSFAQGASTITQQLIRNAMLDPGKRIERKVQEIWLALQLERRYSKEEILEMYLNRILFGHGVYGVEAAARFYFDKSIDELSLAESALLAGVVRIPEYDNPFYDAEGAINRMKLVLGNMKRLGYISAEEYEEAVSEELSFAEPKPITYPYPYFIDYVVHHELIDILTEMPEFGSIEDAYEAIYNGGLKVFTTMNTDYQSHLEDVLNRPGLYPQTIYINMTKLREAVNANNGRLPSDYPNAYIDEENGIPQPQSALVLADPKSGEVLALGGGREYSKNRNELLRYLSPRQPGSSIKPVIAYCSAFERGLLGAGSVLDDSPLIGPQGWRPENYAGNFLGMVTVRRALSWSYNIPAIRAYTEHTGLQEGAEKAYRMGLNTYNPQESVPLPSWAIGSREVTALDMAQAYSVFANNGIRMNLHTVRRIEDRNGNVIYEHEAEPEQVLSREAVFITNSILQDVVTSTTARGLSGLGRPLAAKTGTTDDARDIYLATYAPNLVATFWMGYDIKDMGKITSGWNWSSGLMREVFTEVFKTLPRENFPASPEGVVRVEVCTKSGLRPTELCREAGTVGADYFLRNHVPRLTCDLHVEVEICEASGLLAGEHCPPDQVVKEIRFNRPEFIVTDGGWPRGAGRKPLDAEEMPPEETCDIHFEFPAVFLYFTASTTAERHVLLTWEYSGEAPKEFHLYRQTKNNNGDEAELIKKLGKNANSHHDRNVPPGTYIYTLYAVDKHGNRSQPAVVEVTLHEHQPQLPGKPEIREWNVETDDSGYKVTIKWDYEGSPVDWFRVYRDGRLIHTVNTSEDDRREYTDTNLEPDTYRYQIEAENDDGISKSDEVKITIKDEEPSGKSGDGHFFGGSLLDRLRGFLSASFWRLTI